NHLIAYFGYLAHIVGRAPTWADLFDTGRLHAFTRWHAARIGRRMPQFARRTVSTVVTIARVLEHQEAAALAAWHKKLPPATEAHARRDHWVPLSTLEAIAEACLTEARLPLIQGPRKTNRHPGAKRASRFQKGLVLKLIVRIPLRQRNIREMKLDKNLY